MTQRITAVDLKHRRIRLPKPAKSLFPDRRATVNVELRGRASRVRYDPRLGPDRERSATLVFAHDFSSVVAENEVLSIVAGEDGVLIIG